MRQSLQHNSCYISNDSVCLTKFYVFTHSRLFEWKPSSKCFFVKSHKWNSSCKFEMGQWTHIRLSTSPSLVVIWKVFIVYLQFAIYHDNSNFTNKNFNHLISISKWDFFDNQKLFFGFWTMLFQVPFAKNPFNII